MAFAGLIAWRPRRLAAAYVVTCEWIGETAFGLSIAVAGAKTEFEYGNKLPFSPIPSRYIG
jgi:hypothetical protein